MAALTWISRMSLFFSKWSDLTDLSVSNYLAAVVVEPHQAAASGPNHPG
jgi:hypothetical protein